MNRYRSQSRNLTGNAGGVRRIVTMKMKSTSNAEEGHSRRLGNKCAAITESVGSREDSSGEILLLDHVITWRFFVLLGVTIEKEEVIVVWNARGVEGGGRCW